ncbi:hypothetical protein SAMN05444162_1815 [Paenibacillaceae bacterium GAS479]|nr:hypothetical protein SAMN05444162_1815 [Paenibacillaceae bacterium GAS479]
MSQPLPMTEQQLEQLDDRQLVIKFMEPVLVPLRGASDARKVEALKALPASLRPLFLLRVLDGHAAGSAWEYYVWTGILLQSPDTWPAVLGSLRELGALELLETLADTAAVHRKRMDGLDTSPIVNSGIRSVGDDAVMAETDGTGTGKVDTGGIQRESLPSKPSYPPPSASDLERSPELQLEMDALYAQYKATIQEAYRSGAELIRAYVRGNRQPNS